MSTVDEQTAGTAEQDGGDESKDLTGTPAQDDRNAESGEVDETQKEIESLRRFKEQALAEKATLEELKRKVSEYESRQNPPPTTEPTRTDPDPMGNLEEHIANLKMLSKSEDKYTASVAITSLLALDATRRAMLKSELGRLPENDAQEAESLLVSGKIRDVSVAREMVALKRRLAELEKTKGQEAEKADLAAAKRDTAPATATRSLTAAEMANRRMKRSDYNNRMGSLPQEERQSLYQKVSSGQIKVVDD